MRVFAYYRTSSDIQKDSWQSQQLACREYSTENKLIIVEEFIEKGSAFSERPIFYAMLEKLSDVDAVLVFDLDRMVRDPNELGKVLDLFQSTGKKILQISSSIDPDRDEDMLLARIKTSVAEYETKKFKQRVKAGINRYKEEHGRWGRKPKISKKKFQQYLDGEGDLILSKTSTAKMLDVGRSTLISWMKKNGYEHLIKKQPEHLVKKNLKAEMLQ